MKNSHAQCPVCNKTSTDHVCTHDIDCLLNTLNETGAKWIGKTILGRYKINKYIGSGGMADVFQASRGKSEKQFAVKILNNSFVKDSVINERFKQEAMLISLIAHKNVVSIEDFGTLNNGTYVMIMELLKGKTVGELLLQGPIDPITILNIIMQSCEGMAAAHERGVIHRDLKPDNLFIQLDKKNAFTVKILDLGIGKLFNNQIKKGITAAGTIFGTPAYMSPEQCNGENASIQSDIYSLGIVLYEMLFGFVPFDDEAQMVVLSKHVIEKPLWHDAFAEQLRLPSKTKQVVMKALEKEPEKRFESMLEFQKEIAALKTELLKGKRPGISPSPSDFKTRPVAQKANFHTVPLNKATGSENEIVALTEGIYWTGRRHGISLECNPYLITATGGTNRRNILIDPGPPRDLQIVKDKITEIIGTIDNLDFIYLNHQDPDVAANTVYLQQMNPHIRVICTEDTWRLARHYGLNPKRYISTETLTDFEFNISSGEVIKIVPTPFCHFRGAAMLYHTNKKVLLSGDLFGGLSNDTSFIAKRSALQGIKMFHEIYMPSKRAVDFAIDSLMKLSPAPLIIAPQHGALITGTMLGSVLEMLKQNKMGMDLLLDNLYNKDAIKAANKIVSLFASISGDDQAVVLLKKYYGDGHFSNIFEIAPPLTIESFRINKKLALETLIHDALKLIKPQFKNRFIKALKPIRLYISSL